MITGNTVANLLKQGDRRPAIKFEEIPIHLVGDDNALETNVGLYIISSKSYCASDTRKLYHEKRFRAMSKCGYAVAVLAGLLNYQEASEHHEKLDTTCWEKKGAFVKVGDVIIVADETFSGSQTVESQTQFTSSNRGRPDLKVPPGHIRNAPSSLADLSVPLLPSDTLS